MMKTVKDKMIKEHIPIEQCQPDDLIYIRKSVGSTCGYGSFLVVKVKLLPRGIVQLKYKGTYKTSTVQKGVIPVGTMVERTRKATAADGPNTGSYAPNVITVPASEPHQSVIPTTDVELTNVSAESTPSFKDFETVLLRKVIDAMSAKPKVEILDPLPRHISNEDLHEGLRYGRRRHSIDEFNVGDLSGRVLGEVVDMSGSRLKRIEYE